MILTGDVKLKLSELMFTVLIFVLVACGCVSAFYAFRTGIERVVDNHYITTSVVKFDGEVRQEVSRVVIPYWKNNDENITNDLVKSLSKIAEKYNVKIYATRILMRRNTAFGLLVKWEYDGKKFETMARFASN